MMVTKTVKLLANIIFYLKKLSYTNRPIDQVITIIHK